MYDHKPDLDEPTPIELAARLVRGTPTYSDCAWAAAMLRDFHDTLTARESELAEAKRRVAELEANLDAGRELMRVAWSEFNSIRARDGAPTGVYHDYWNELTEGLRGLLCDDATPWMTRAARALVQPYENRVGRLTSELFDMELRAIAAEKKLADRITHIPGKEDDDGEMH